MDDRVHEKILMHFLVRCTTNLVVHRTKKKVIWWRPSVAVFVGCFILQQKVLARLFNFIVSIIPRPNAAPVTDRRG